MLRANLRLCTATHAATDKGGIMTGNLTNGTCSDQRVDHAVLLVGCKLNGVRCRMRVCVFLV